VRISLEVHQKEIQELLGKDKDQIKNFQNPNMYGFVCVSLVLNKASRIDKANIESLVRR